MAGIFNSISKAFGGPANSGVPVNSDMPLEAPIETTSSLNSKTVLTPRTFRTRNGEAALEKSVSQTTAPLARANKNLGASLAQSGGRRMRSKSKSLRPSLFLKYKYKMARRSMTMRKGRKGRKGSRKARR